MQTILWLSYILKSEQNREYFADDIFKCIFLYQNVRILIKFY